MVVSLARVNREEDHTLEAVAGASDRVKLRVVISSEANMPRFSSLLFLGLAVPLLASAGAPMPPERGQFVGAGCEEVNGLFLVDAAAAREIVPARFAVVGEETGRAIAILDLIRCGSLSVNEGPASAAYLSHLGILIESPDGTPTTNAYLAWKGTDRADIVAVDAALGLDTRLAAFRLDVEPGGPLLPDHVSALVDGPRGYAWEGDARNPRYPLPGGASGVLWQEGPRGLVRIYGQWGGSLQYAETLAALSAPPGSVVHGLVGPSVSTWGWHYTGGEVVLDLILQEP